MKRWIRFIIAILIGVAIGVLFGWYIIPNDQPNAGLQNLRIDYKTDYVLMVAEAFESSSDRAQAVRWLAMLGDEFPEKRLLESISFAEETGYTELDLELLQNLATELELIQKIVETPEK